MTIISCLGDSTTAGTPLFKSPIEAPPDGEGDERSQFTYWLEHMRPDWRVLNRGVNGERSDQIAQRFDRDVIGHAPAVIVIIAGVNDVYQGRRATDVIGQLNGMYARAREHGLPVVAGTIVPYNSATAAQNREMHAINDWILSEAAKDQHVLAVDTRSAVAAADNPDRLAGSPDGLHPDIDGYRRMAEALAPAIARATAAAAKRAVRAQHAPTVTRALRRVHRSPGGGGNEGGQGS